MNNLEKVARERIRYTALVQRLNEWQWDILKMSIEEQLELDGEDENLKEIKDILSDICESISYINFLERYEE